MKKNILIELTPLLDVILIMLFLILVQSEGRVGDIYYEMREAFEVEAAQVEAEFEAFKAQHAIEMDHLRAVNENYTALRLGLEEDAGVIQISLLSDPMDLDTRWILIESTSQTVRIDLNWNIPARDAAALELNTAIADKIQYSGNAIIVILFRHNGARSFVSDRQLINNAIHIQRQFNQLVVTELDIRS